MNITHNLLSLAV